MKIRGQNSGMMFRMEIWGIPFVHPLNSGYPGHRTRITKELEIAVNKTFVDITPWADGFRDVKNEPLSLQVANYMLFCTINLGWLLPGLNAVRKNLLTIDV